MKIEDYSKYYIQGSDHYLIPKDEFKELFNEMINWREETKELKKQLEDKTELSNEIINKIKYEIISQCIEDKEIEKLLTIIESVRWNI